MLRIVNRVLLGLAGLVLVVLGGSVLAVGLGLKPPSWWIHDGRHDVLLSDADRARWRDDGWWWPTVIAVLAVCVLLGLWWLTAVLRGRALEGVLADEAGQLDGVQRAQVLLTGRRSTPETRVQLLLEPHVDPGRALHSLTTEALAHARDSAGLAALPAEVRLRGVKHRAERVS